MGLDRVHSALIADKTENSPLAPRTQKVYDLSQMVGHVRQGDYMHADSHF